jgi:hypothetical protein
MVVNMVQNALTILTTIDTVKYKALKSRRYFRHFITSPPGYNGGNMPQDIRELKKQTVRSKKKAAFPPIPPRANKGERKTANVSKR